jgi:hypothetical protein
MVLNFLCGIELFSALQKVKTRLAIFLLSIIVFPPFSLSYHDDLRYNYTKLENDALAFTTQPTSKW